MADLTIKGPLFPLQDSLCNNCKYRISRALIPLDLETFGLTEESLEELDIEEDETLIIEQHSCIVLQEDMDYIVQECNHYQPNKGNGLFLNNIL